MKKAIFFLFVIFLIAHYSMAQNRTYNTAVEQFQDSYNQKDYEAIFESFSVQMKKALPLEKTKEFFTGLYQQFGKIKEKEFSRYENQTFAVYKTSFEKGILGVNISVDTQGKINGLLIQPFQEPVSQKEALNMIDDYPPRVAELLYEKAKDLPNGAQFSVAIVQNDEVSYYGIIRENDSIKTVENRDKVFEIGSITKVFTSTVLASLVREGKLQLTDNINDYYDFDFKSDAQISFESLAMHTAGLPRLPTNLDLTNKENPYKEYGEEELEYYLKELLNPQEIGTYDYSNLGAGLLGHTLGKSQHTTFQELLKERVLKKYGMTNSFAMAQEIKDDFVKGMKQDGKKVSNWDFDVLFGAGGMLSTAEDLAKFAKAHFDDKNKELLLTRKTVSKNNESTKTSLGWHIVKTNQNEEFIWHNGGTGGYSSSMAIDPENKRAVIILTNVAQVTNDLDQMCFRLMKP